MNCDSCSEVRSINTIVQYYLHFMGSEPGTKRNPVEKDMELQGLRQITHSTANNTAAKEPARPVMKITSHAFSASREVEYY